MKKHLKGHTLNPTPLAYEGGGKENRRFRPGGVPKDPQSSGNKGKVECKTKLEINRENPEKKDN